MNRSWVIWGVLLGCAVLILGMFAWVTESALKSEKERQQAEAMALLGERVRLSLSRMDGIGSDLLVSENLRAPMVFEPYFSPNNILTNQLQTVDQNLVLQASPLLTAESEWVALHFEVKRHGVVSSPQVPVGNEKERATGSGVAESKLAEMERRLARVKKRLPSRSVISGLFGEEIDLAKEDSLAASQWMMENGNNFDWQKPDATQAYNTNLDKQEEASRSKLYQKRVQKAAQQSVEVSKEQVKPTNKAPAPVIDPDEILSVSPYMPMWHEGDLYFFREVRRMRSRTYQGLWMAKDLLMEALMAEVPADLGEAILVRSDQAPEGAARLVSLPWALVPGALPEVKTLLLTPLHKTLIAGWVAAFLALVALALLLAGVMKLSARRAAFVSSVTHELRTPLTTFRLYSEMLADGMVKDEAKRLEYLRTMVGESERLNHLVENVLSYARIERGNARSKFENLSVTDLIERMRPVLQRRVDQEDAALSIEVDETTGRVETDVTAVEQILFNLIDNACKYGLPESGSGRILLKVRKGRGGLRFEVSDEGRGIARDERRRLFQAFHKSAHEAAHDKPGVGLGLALCRRLARALGGELKLGKREGAGACFVLLLKA